MPMRRWLREREKWKTGWKMRWAFGGPEKSPDYFGGFEPSPDYFGWTEPGYTYFGGSQPYITYFGGPDHMAPPFGARPAFPPVDMYEEGDEIVIIADVPGFSKEDLKIQVKEDAVVISGERREKLTDRVKEDNIIKFERYVDKFSRRLELPVPVDPDTAKARFESGMLKITIKKQEGEKAKEIPIE